MILTRRSLLQLLGIGSAAVALPKVEALDHVESAAPDDDNFVSSRPTLLEHFLRLRSIKPAHLARESGSSRQHLLRVRFGRLLPSLTCIAAIVVAIRRLTRDRVLPEQLFEAAVIRAAWRDTRFSELEDYQRVELRAAFGRRTLREFLGGQA